MHFFRKQTRAGTTPGGLVVLVGLSLLGWGVQGPSLNFGDSNTTPVPPRYAVIDLGPTFFPIGLNAGGTALSSTNGIWTLGTVVPLAAGPYGPGTASAIADNGNIIGNARFSYGNPSPSPSPGYPTSLMETHACMWNNPTNAPVNLDSNHDDSGSHNGDWYTSFEGGWTTNGDYESYGNAITPTTYYGTTQCHAWWTAAIFTTTADPQAAAPSTNSLTGSLPSGPQSWITGAGGTNYCGNLYDYGYTPSSTNIVVGLVNNQVIVPDSGYVELNFNGVNTNAVVAGTEASASNPYPIMHEGGTNAFLPGYGSAFAINNHFMTNSSGANVASPQVIGWDGSGNPILWDQTNPDGSPSTNTAYGGYIAKKINDLIPQSGTTSINVTTIAAINDSGAIVGTATYTQIPYAPATHGVMLCPVAAVSDPNNTYTVDNTNPVLTYVRFGLWDNAFDNSVPANVLNGNSESGNFVGSDSRRFYIRIYDPSATTTTVTVDWYTKKSDGTDEDHPATDTITLTRSSSNPALYVSKALMLVADEVDNAQPTNTGLSGGGNAAEGAADHRLRRAALGDTMCYAYTPGETGSTKQTFSLPIFGGSEPVKTMTVQVANLYQGSSFTLAQTDSYIQAIQASVQSHYAVAGIKVNFQYAYGGQDDWVSIPSTTGIDLNSMNGGSGSSTGDEGRIAAIVKAKYSGADSHTIFLILTQQFKSTVDPSGNTDQDQGDTISAGLNSYYGGVDAPSVNCCFAARLGIGADSATTCVPPHELGHQLTCPTADYITSNNHYNGPQAQENLMINGALDPTPGLPTNPKRLWDDSGHSYPNIPITNQIDFMRQSPLLQ